MTNREEEIKALLDIHDQKGTTEKRIGQFTSEFLSHLPLGEFMANWVYLLCAQLGYTGCGSGTWCCQSPTGRDKRIRRCIGLIAAKVVQADRFALRSLCLIAGGRTFFMLGKRSLRFV